jgi:hypothetical protein
MDPLIVAPDGKRNPHIDLSVAFPSTSAANMGLVQSGPYTGTRSRTTHYSRKPTGETTPCACRARKHG